MGKGSKHPGFKAVASKVAKEKGPSGKPLGPKAAGAIVASGARNASKAAHKANPKLNKVKG
jgi:hypothetical protein